MDLNYLSIDTARGNCEREEIFYPFIKYCSKSKVIEMAALAVTDGKFKSFFQPLKQTTMYFSILFTNFYLPDIISNLIF